MIIVTSSFHKLRIFKCFPYTVKLKASVFKFLGFESVFEMLRYLDGLVWTIGLTVEKNTAFSDVDFSGAVKYQLLCSHVCIAFLNASQIEVDFSDITLMTNIKLFGNHISKRSFKKLH